MIIQKILHMNNRWDSLQPYLFVEILDRLDDLQDFVAAISVCKAWRQNSYWVSSLTFKRSKHYNRHNPFPICKKHGYEDFKCDCVLICLSNIISHSVCLSKLVLNSMNQSAALCNMLEHCSNWLTLSQTLQHLTLRCSYQHGLSSKLCELISSCKSLRELEIHYLGKHKLPSSLTSQLHKLRLLKTSYRDSVQYSECSNLVELRIDYMDGENNEISLSLPNLQVLDIAAFTWSLQIHAPVAHDITISLSTYVYVHANSVKKLALYDSQLIQGPRDLEKLELLGHHLSQDSLEGSLLSCTAVLGITSLKFCPSMSESVRIDANYTIPSADFSRCFFNVLTQLSKLKELELTFDVVLQLDPEHSKLNGSFQSLDVLALNVSAYPLHLYWLPDLEDESPVHAQAIQRFLSTWTFLKDLFACKKVKVRNQGEPVFELMSFLENRV